ncbi:hypothetical protein C2E23DRAFT_815598 [Lenzites betulinus]|nr:hypothetical protein C2E23DRAFT_815598 [Lenzites betulinus]
MTSAPVILSLPSAANPSPPMGDDGDEPFDPFAFSPYDQPTDVGYPDTPFAPTPEFVVSPPDSCDFCPSNGDLCSPSELPLTPGDSGSPECPLPDSPAVAGMWLGFGPGLTYGWALVASPSQSFSASRNAEPYVYDRAISPYETYIQKPIPAAFTSGCHEVASVPASTSPPRFVSSLAGALGPPSSIPANFHASEPPGPHAPLHSDTSYGIGRSDLDVQGISESLGITVQTAGTAVDPLDPQYGFLSSPPPTPPNNAWVAFPPSSYAMQPVGGGGIGYEYRRVVCPTDTCNFSGGQCKHRRYTEEYEGGDLVRYYLCDYPGCKKRYRGRYPKNLLEHERVKHTPGFEPFKCTLCKSFFTRSNELQKHIREKHPPHC